MNDALLPSEKMGFTSSIDVRKLDFLWLELTQKCNLTCSHCYASSSPNVPLVGIMQHEDWVRALDEAASLGCQAVQFIGGEPLLYPRIEELITHAKMRDYRLIEIYTNATPITRKRAKFFAKFGVRIACSFYSAEPLIHDIITNKVGSFEKTLKSLGYLREERVPVRFGFIEMDQNKGHFDRARGMLNGMGFESVRFDSIRGFGRGEGQAENMQALAGKYGGLCGQCSRNRLSIDYSGSVSPCPMSRDFVVGDFFDGGILGTLSGESLATFQDEMDAEMAARHEAALRNISNCGPMQRPDDAPPCGPGPVPCMVCGPGNCHPDFPCTPDNSCPICMPGICMPG